MVEINTNNMLGWFQQLPRIRRANRLFKKHHGFCSQQQTVRLPSTWISTKGGSPPYVQWGLGEGADRSCTLENLTSHRQQAGRSPGLPGSPAPRKAVSTPDPAEGLFSLNSWLRMH